MRQTFPYARRLHRQEEFKSALHRRALIDGQLALYAETKGIGPERLGIVVTKRVVAKAVDRNRIKRIIRETFRITSPHNYDDSLDIVVRVRSSPNKGEITEFRQSLSRLLMKVRMIKNDAPVSLPHKGLPISD